jgi:hypothetical protein
VKGKLDDEQRRFTKEFEDEAVRLVATSGRTQRVVADDLALDCRRWCDGSAAGVIGFRRCLAERRRQITLPN